MASIHIQNRIAEIRGPGRLFVSSDLHGNLADFRRLTALLESNSDCALLLLGDLFHGPAATKSEWAEEYDHLGDYYPDESDELFREALTIWARYPGRVASLMGNHEHAHVGGPVVSKFHLDESGHFNSRLKQSERESLHQFIREMPLIAHSSCGIVMTHAAPPEAYFDRQSLTDLDFSDYEHLPLHCMWSQGFLGEVLWRRSSSLSGTETFLTNLRNAGVDGPCTLVVHGHEVVREGWIADHPLALNLSTSFGMKRDCKTILELDLDTTYEDASALRPGVELRSLY